MKNKTELSTKSPQSLLSSYASFTPLLLVLGMIFCTSASAADINVYNVSDLQTAASSAKAGDRVLIHGGTYRIDAESVKPVNSGTSTSPITYMAASSSDNVVL